MKLASDLRGPLLDRGPVAKVARLDGVVRGHAAHQPLDESEGRRLGIPGTEEHLRAARMDRRGQLVELLRPAAVQDVVPLGVDALGAEGSAAEQPHRASLQHGPMTSHEPGGVLEPVEHVGGRPDHERVVPIDGADLRHRPRLCRDAGGTERVGDALGDPGGLDHSQLAKPDQVFYANLDTGMNVTNIAEAKATLSKLLERVLAGDEVVIGKAGRPVARLVPFDRDISPRDIDQGVWLGRVWMADDFDGPPADVLAAFGADDEPTP